MNFVSQLMVAGGVSVVNIAIHAVATTSVIELGRAMAKSAVAPSSAFLIRVMIATVSALMFAHFCEVCVWALAYSTLDIMPGAVSVSSVYFAFVNYTTLGYGDVVPIERWNLLGPATAMNGVLLFGWSTAVIFEILRRAIVVSTHALPGSERPSVD